MIVDPPPRILFRAVPDDVKPTFEGLPGTHTFIDSGEQPVHASDFDLLVTFEPTFESAAGWHVLGFGLLYAELADRVTASKDLERFARHADIAEGADAQTLRPLLTETILDHPAEPPWITWSATQIIPGHSKSRWDTGNFAGHITPLVHVAAEQYVYAFRAKQRDGIRLVWALPAETTDHRAWLMQVLEELSQADPARFPGDPDWQGGTIWAPPALLRAHTEVQQRLHAHARLLEQAELNIAAARQQVEEERARAASGPWLLLTAQDDELVQAVRDALIAFGFNAVELDEEHHRRHKRRLEDLRVTDPTVEHWESLVEVKGYTKGAKARDVDQVTKAPSVYFAAEHGRPPAVVWHIVNTELGVDPSRRRAVFPNPADLASLTEASGALIDTRDLFRAWCAVQDGTAESSDIRASLRTALTRWILVAADNRTPEAEGADDASPTGS